MCRAGEITAACGVDGRIYPWGKQPAGLGRPEDNWGQVLQQKTIVVNNWGQVLQSYMP